MKKKQLIALGAIVFVLAAACSNPFFPEKHDNGGVNNDIPVAGVSLNKTTLTLDIGGTETLIATVAPANAANKAVTWSSSNTAVATVSNGAVTAVSAGSAEITVTTEDGGKTASCAVTVAGSGPQTVTYTGTDGEGTSYELEITGDDYILTVTGSDGTTNTSAGKVVDDDGNGTLTLAPDADPDETFTITLGEDDITDIDGTITFDDGTKKEPPVIVTPVSITVAAVTVTPPAKGDTPVYTADTGDEGYTCGAVTWSPAVSSTFLGDTKYTATVTLTANENYVFAGGLTAKINDTDAVVTNNTGSAVTLSLEFDATLALAVTGIAIKTQPSKLAYIHGETLDLDGLVVTLSFEDGTSEDVAFANFGTNITTVPANGAVLSRTAHDGEPVVVSFGELTAETDDLTVSPKVITFTVDPIPAQTYTGSALTPTVTVSDSTTILTRPDYTVAYTDNTSVGTAAVTITGEGNYAGSSGSANFTINKANPTVTWPTAAAVTYGQTLANAVFTGGSADVAGTFAWTNGATIPTVTNSGYQVTFTPTDTANYNTLTQNVNITVSYRVSFNTNEGGSIPDQTITTDGVTVSRPSNPTRSGYVFDTWYTDAGLTVPYNFAAIVTDNITLYARWISADIISDIVNNIVPVTAGNTNLQFQMGQSGDGSSGNVTPVHTVTFTQGFSMGKYQVTQGQYQAVMGTNPSYFTTANSRPPDGDETDARRPVEMVSWYDALVFCNKLSMLEGLTPAYSISGSTDPAVWGTVPTSSDATWNAAVVVAGSTGYRLPTEAQWEYAAKGGPLASNPPKIYSGSDTVGDVAWYSSNSNSKTHEVGKKTANELGLYDMSGNVWEWCWDWYGTYPSEAQTDPAGASSGSLRVGRGGGFGDPAGSVRSVSRYYFNGPSYGDFVLGFRLLRPAQ